MRNLPKPPTPPPVLHPSAEEKRAALEAHRSLQETCTTLQSNLLNPTISAESIASTLSSTQHHLDTLRAYLSVTIEPEFYNTTIPPHSTATAAQRTFAVPELFDMILSHLPIPSILAFQQTSKESKARIDHSTHLQTLLCLRPARPDSHFHTPFDTELAHAPGGGFYCKVPGFRQGYIRRNDNGTATFEVLAVFVLQGPEQRLPRIGSTYRKMFVTQPPTQEMTPRIRCCRGPEILFVRETGITIGDLYDVAVETIAKHRWCSGESHASRMLEDGQNPVAVEFTRKVTVASSDPIVRRLLRERAKKESEEKRRRWVRKRNTVYMEARNSGKFESVMSMDCQM